MDTLLPFIPPIIKDAVMLMALGVGVLMFIDNRELRRWIARHPTRRHGSDLLPVDIAKDHPGEDNDNDVGDFIKVSEVPEGGPSAGRRS